MTLCRGIHDICSLRFTSGATPLPVYNAGIAASRLLRMCISAEVGCQDAANMVTIIAGSLESAYSLIRGALQIWGQDLGTFIRPI